MHKKIIFGLAATVMLVGPLAYSAAAQTPVPTGVTLQVTQLAPDEKGTDVINAYEIKLSLSGAALPTGGEYELVLYLDNRSMQRFPISQVPVFIVRNFKGQSAGVHQIRVDLVERVTHVLASAQQPITVVR